MASLTLFSPAKLNLFLAVTGRRPDGFHDLVSVVTPLEFGDTLTVELEETAGAVPYALSCDDPAVPTDETNLVLRAARAFALASGWRGGARFRLKKRIPVGAGLGGGSSNGAVALRALNELTGNPLSGPALAATAAELGSDCPLFLAGGPAVMRGRGERLELLPGDAATRLHGRRVLVFKPAFSVSTPWAYRRLAELAAAQAVPAHGNNRAGQADGGEAGGAAVSDRGYNKTGRAEAGVSDRGYNKTGRAEAGVSDPGDVKAGQAAYLPAAAAEKKLAGWIGDGMAAAEALLYNGLETAVFEKYLALPTLLASLRSGFGLQPRMTGSGSACFAFLGEQAPVHEITAAIRDAWGAAAFVVETRLL